MKALLRATCVVIMWRIVEIKIHGCQENAIFVCAQGGKHSGIVPKFRS